LNAGSSSKDAHLSITDQRTQPLSFQESLRGAARRIQNTRLSRVSSALAKQLLHNWFHSSKKNCSINSSTHPQQSLVSQRSEAFSGEDRGWGAIRTGCGAFDWLSEEAGSGKVRV
jgi:hypothetical protein